jgi:lactate dehydrogenase-like 2-hydroxyacid dehydrogenase
MNTASKLVLVVTRPPTLPPEVAERANRDFVVRLAETPESLTSDGLVELSDGASGFLVTPFDRIDASFFERVAAIRAGEWAHAAPIALIGRQLTGKVLGILGMGRIGQAVAHRARALGMQIHYTNPFPLSEDLAHGAVFHQDPLELLRVSEFLSLHAPATPDTHHFLNAETLALLPRGVIVVNTARGELIRDEDLLAALDAGTVAAVGLDVFEHEPKIDPRYLTLKNAFLMPHLAAETIETQTAVGMLALDNIDAVLSGSTAPSLVTV